MTNVIDGIKLIEHNASGVHEPDDPTYPWLLEAALRPPEFMLMTFVGLFGGQEIVRVRGKTKDALEEFANTNNLYNHPRLHSLTITQPEVMQ